MVMLLATDRQSCSGQPREPGAILAAQRLPALCIGLSHATPECDMNIAVRVDAAVHEASPVEYRWDADTEILTASVNQQPAMVSVGDGTPLPGGASGSVGLEGSDGSWVILDVAKGRINGVEVAVWPDLRKRASLVPPAEVEDALVSLPDVAGVPDVASLEMDTSLVGEADSAERTIHFRLGKTRRVRTVRIARDLLLDIDGRNRIAGVWLLNVPPCPDPS